MDSLTVGEIRQNLGENENHWVHDFYAGSFQEKLRDSESYEKDVMDRTNEPINVGTSLSSIRLSLSFDNIV